MSNEDQSFGDQQTSGGSSQPENEDLQSLGDQQTLAGGLQGSAQSLGDEATLGGVLGAESPLIDDMEVVDLAARYTTEGVLGKGGMGEVLLATDTRLERKVAIKRILGEAAKSRNAVNRFLTEAKSIAALNHPNIVQIFDYGRAEDGPFLIMEYVDGGSLQEKCREGALDLEQAVDLTCQLCDGLGKAHEAGIVHRDIKPANVLLTGDGIPKLTDFGLAKDETADTGHTMAGAVLGTLDFMPPEQRKDAALTDTRSDLWSLAATLYQLVTGKSPKIIRFNDVPKSLQDVLGKALEDNKDDRYQNATEFRDDLRAALQGAGEVELEEGVCPGCGARNPVDRKFCRNPDCGIDLQVPCLSCAEKIPMWEGVCDSCGAKQRDLLDERRQEMSSQQLDAESLLKRYDFNEAIRLATVLRDEPDLRLQHLKGWAEKFLSQVEKGRKQQLVRVGTLLKEAIAHEKAYDYSSGIHTLEQVPEILRTSEIPNQSQTAGELLEQLQEEQSRSQKLDTEIRQRVESRQLNGLQSQVEELLELRPDRKDLQKLKQQLVEREEKLVTTRDNAVVSAKQLLEQQDYEGAIKELEQIDPYVQTEEVERLLTEATQRRDQLEGLQKEIDKAVAEKQLNGLLKQVDEYLALKSDDEKMIALRERLIKRDQKNAAQIASALEKAQALRKECRFDAAFKLLEKIPETLQTQEIKDLQDSCKLLAQMRSAAMYSLREEYMRENYEAGLNSAKSYTSTLKSEMLQDKEYQQLFKLCCEALKEQREATDAAFRKRVLQFNLGIVSAALMVMVLLIVTGLRARRTMQASALAEAVQGQKWDEALAIDDQHVPALIGRANQLLSSAPPDLEAAFADLKMAERLGGTASGLSQTMGVAHAMRAKEHAVAGKISEAERDLNQAEQLQVAENLLTAVRQPLAAAYIQQAQADAQSSKPALALVNTLRALDYDASVLVPVEVLEITLDEAVKQFESVNTDTNRDNALVLIARLIAADTNSEKVLVLQQRAGGVLMKRSMATVQSDLTGSAMDYITAVELGVDDDPVLNEQLRQKLENRCRQFLAGSQIKKAVADYGTLQKLDEHKTKLLLDEFANLPVGVLAQLPVDLMSQLPVNVLSSLPLDVLSELPVYVLSQLPPRQNSINMEFKLLPGGTFTMGGNSGNPDEKPVHLVTLKQAFELGVYEVTQEQYEKVMRTNPSEFDSAQNPVERVSWNDAVAFCRKLSELPEEKAAGYVYRLPTEAEWEYACRAGTDTEYSFGDSDAQLGEYAWYDNNSGQKTHPVGQKKPNPWGLYDMYGNVYEWCQDWYSYQYSRGPHIDPGGASKGSLRVNRGGGWSLSSGNCRSAYRGASTPGLRLYSLGFRVLRSSTK